MVHTGYTAVRSEAALAPTAHSEDTEDSMAVPTEDSADCTEDWVACMEDWMASMEATASQALEDTVANSDSARPLAVSA